MMLAALLLGAAAADVKVLPGWRIHERPESCMMETIYKDGSYLQIEYHPGQLLYSLLIANPAWDGIEDGREYPVTLGWSGPNKELKVNGLGIRDERPFGMLYVTFDGVPYTQDRKWNSEWLRRGRALVVEAEGVNRAVLDLPYFRRALERTERCAQARYSYASIRKPKAR